MLPSFPKSQRILDDEWNKRMLATKYKIFPLELHPPVLQIIEGKNSDFQREDRTVKRLNIERHEVTVKLNTEDGKGMTLELFYKKAKEAGEGMGRDMWKIHTDAIEEAVAETGNEVKITKGNLTQENLLQILEMGQHNFDDQGNPTGQFVCGSEFMEEIKNREREWSQDRQFLAKVEEAKARKRAEFNEREARRRLVG